MVAGRLLLRSLRERLHSGVVDADRALFAGHGFASFVQKPFRPAELVAKLRAILEPDARV